MFIKLFSKVFENIKTWLTFSTDEHFPRSFQFIIKTIVLNVLEEIFKANRKNVDKIETLVAKESNGYSRLFLLRHSNSWTGSSEPCIIELSDLRSYWKYRAVRSNVR